MALALPTGPRGQMLALGLALLAAIAVWLGVIAPLWGWYDDRAELLRRQRAMAHRMASLVESLPALRRQAETLDSTVTSSGAANNDTSAVLLTGANDPVAAASLQQRIEELATQAGVRVGSEEILPAQAEGDLRAIAVRLTLTAPFRSLVGLLLALSRSETPMVVDELLLRGPPGKPGDDDLPIDVSMTVTSYRAAKAETP
jgi:general secretion pathway protein M